ncbi:ABC transporter ATP-binding protein [Streptomyces iconiensis]|uniref:ATP-binding cassette domain-containing protein n=1 Tax=Streptomyces iconiensis TaxID=1384038 RepID=A0ABT7A991_9ACTN|nr:ATP-binding cassette domain-containing protein [Streptomyces iconiensis]MDJ1137559.1 ATP-binding cassette domain-containing protein [Streptomyces iconiensis]
MGIEVAVEGLTKSFGRKNIWQDVTLTLPAGEVSVMLGPSGTGKTVFLKSLIGLIKPEHGSVTVDGVDMVNSRERDVYEARKLFGLMFQDGALFGSMNLFDNIAFPLREHTKKKETEIRRIVMERLDMVGLVGDEGKLPGEISGGMRKRAGLARALVLDPQIILCDEPDSGLDPVRTAFTSQLLIDLNAQIDATMLIVTHNLDIAATVPDNMGMLFRRNLVTFGPREVLLTSEEPVVAQFLSGSRTGPIGMSEEKDAATLAREADGSAAGAGPLNATSRELVPQLEPTAGLPERKAVARRRERVKGMLGQLPPAARSAIEASMPQPLPKRSSQRNGGPGADVGTVDPEAPTLAVDTSSEPVDAPTNAADTPSNGERT